MDKPDDNCCRWIYGDVRGGTATWCGVPTRCGEPWCKVHRGMVYVACRPRVVRKGVTAIDPTYISEDDSAGPAKTGDLPRELPVRAVAECGPPGKND